MTVGWRYVDGTPGHPHTIRQISPDNDGYREQSTEVVRREGEIGTRSDSHRKFRRPAIMRHNFDSSEMPSHRWHRIVKVAAPIFLMLVLIASPPRLAFASDQSDNHAPTGLPVISGTTQLGGLVINPDLVGVAWVGQTLTASVSGIADEDGLTNVDYAYQWISIDGSTDTDIDGATAATYSLTNAEKFKRVKVRVTFTDDGGTVETLVSEPTSMIFGGSANPPSVTVACFEPVAPPVLALPPGFEDLSQEEQEAIDRYRQEVANRYRPRPRNPDNVEWFLRFSEGVDRVSGFRAFQLVEVAGQDDTDFGGFLAHVPGADGSVVTDGYERVWHFSLAPWVPGTFGDTSDVNGVVVTVPAGRWRDREGNPNTASSNSLYRAHNWQVSVSDANAEEGTDGTIDFDVTLNARDDCKTVTVDWATEDGTAVAGEDYTEGSGTLTFGPGETTKTVSVVVLDDKVEDSGETFTLRLSNAVGATIVDGEATGTIFNSESPFNSLPQIAGAAQVGNTLSVSFTEAPGGTVTYQWLRGSAEIAGATASTYAPLAADVGEALSVRVDGGGDSIASAATVPVWPAPANPPLAAGEEEVLSATLTLGSWDGFPARIAGYSRALDASFGEMDETAFEDGGTSHAVDFLVVNENGQFALATGATRPEAAGLAAYWNEHRIAQFEANTLEEGLRILVGRTPQSGAAYMRYMDGASDGVRVAVSLRRVSVTVQDALTATFKGLPAGHDNAEFKFEIEFSETLKDDFSYKTFAGKNGQTSVLSVMNGAVTGARRLQHDDDRNKRWEITIEPGDTGDIQITLPATTDCAATGAICAEGDRPLSAAVSVTVPTTAPAQVTLEDNAPAKLTASFSTAPPDEHDGSTSFAFRIAFSENLGEYSYKTMRDTSLTVTQGTTRLTPTKVSRVYPNDPARVNKAWNVEVTPQSKEDISIELGPSPACDAAGAMCTEDDRALSNSISSTVHGPPGISVADATVREADGATMDFVVTLSRASGSTVTVDFATSEGSATAGSDYTETSGTLTFAPDDTSKTVSVPVLNDSHNDGGETFTLTLSNPSGGNAYLADATATGTIENTDPMPQAWLARFGRTVAEQVIEAVEGRMAAALRPGVEVTLVGASVLAPGSLSGTGTAGDRDARAKVAADAEAQHRLAALSNGLQAAAGGWKDPGAGPGAGGRRAGIGSRSVTGRDLLTGSSFALTGAAKAGGTVSLWGRGAVSRFDGREGKLTIEGEVTSAMLGADWSRGPDGRGAWTAGLLLARSEGSGSYRGDGAGTVSSSVTGLYPYGRYMMSDRVTLWGVAGYGAGALTLTPEDKDGNAQAAIRTDMDLTMGALGLRGVALEAPADGGIELAVTTDAMAVQTSSDAVSGGGGAGGNLAAASADVTRLRLGLEGTWRGLEAGGGQLAPRLEVGVRHDGGDAETGFGLDLGGGLGWAHAERGISAELSARGLLSHESRGFRDRGISGSLAWDPGGGSGRGPKLTLTQTMGASATGGMDALLGRGTLAGLAANDNGDDELANRRLELRLGYGFSAFGDRFTSTPELGLGLSNGQRQYSLGWRLNLSQSGPTALELALEATRRETANDPGSGSGAGADPEHGIGFRVTARW